MTTQTVSVSRVIASPPAPIFDLLADPSRHKDIDGSGTVKESKEAATKRLRLGDEFGMSMRMGLRYSMVNKVIELEDNRRIAWQPRMAGPMSRLIGGRIWRYELEPTEGGTKVTETWDVSQDPGRIFLMRPMVVSKVTDAMSKTLERIEKLVSVR